MVTVPVFDALSRREFVRSLSALAMAPRETRAELILHNANIHTVDSTQPHAQAVAIAGGRFLAAGSDDDVRNLANSATQQVNMGGKTVVPGFIDAHSHPADAGRRHLREVDCDLRSIADIQKAIRERAAKSSPGTWVLGFKYDDTKTSDGRRLNRQDLDAAAPDHPVLISHRGGHTAYVNSRALKAAHIDEDVNDPPGGKFLRDPSSHLLTGGAWERAVEAFHKVIPSTLTRNDYREGVKLISQMMCKTGLTSVHDALGTPLDLRAYQDARQAGELSVRVYCFIHYPHIDRMIAAGVQTGLGDEWVRVGGMKMQCDGSISERTARLSVPYNGRPDDFGILTMTEEEMYSYGQRAHAAGWQIGVHANGDVAIDNTLRLYERLQREQPRREPRFRIEHCTVINDQLIRRMQALGVIPTPFSTYVYYHGEKMKEYGAERLNSMFALRTFLDAGIRPTLASDYPPGPFEPMMALQSMVTRTDMKGTTWGPKQKVTVAEALRITTLNGAYASYEENLKGSIEPGKLADLVVLGQDPMRVDPNSLVNIPVERTMVGGRWVYER